MKIIQLFQYCWDNEPNNRPKMEEVIEILKKIKV